MVITEIDKQRLICTVIAKFQRVLVMETWSIRRGQQ